MKTATNCTAAIAFAFLLTAGCASAPQNPTDHSNEAQVVEPGSNRAYKMKRLVTKGAHLGWVTARSIYENPINRPISHFGALASYALKSTGGMLRRTAIATVQMPALNAEIPEVSNAQPMDLDAFEKVLDKVTGTRSDTGQIKFLVDGDEYFCRLATAVQNAEDSIDIRTYIFDNDDYAVEFANTLKEKSDDVRVRVMLDSVGNMMAMQADPESMPTGYEGPLSMRTYMERESDVKVRNITNPWLTTGDHTKTTIIDKKIAFVGGMNIGREYRYDWHDLMMEVSGPVVDKLQYESDKAWARASLLGDLANFFAFLKGKKRNADQDGYPVRVLQTRNFDSDIHKAQIAAIQNAQSYILMENAYFSDDRTVYELARARRRGVDVRVIIPSRGNHGALNASNKVTINNLLKHGVRVYEYPGMSHVKAAIYDGWLSVGSANFDKLSLKINKELNLATSDPDTVQALLDQVFIPDMMASRELNTPPKITVARRIAEIAVDELL
jgi:phosphatidylserine/phosphatidylglycerophosphate/cardiolipin synthase-like enzyme